MEERTFTYCKRLRNLCDRIEDPFKREIFYQTCKKFTEHKSGRNVSKNLSKPELISILISKGYMDYRIDEQTGLKTKLPDDRGVRRAIRELLTEGYPIITTSTEGGCFIVEDSSELDKPQEENHSRAVSILAVDKGYNLVRQFLMGQEKFLP